MEIILPERLTVLIFVQGISCVCVCVCCLLYTSDAADERSSVDLGGRRIIKKKNRESSGEERLHKYT